MIDRTKGYFPVPGIRHLHGEVLDMVRDALTNDAARARGLFRREPSTRCWPHPTTRAPRWAPTRCGSSAVLEMWLQSMES